MAALARIPRCHKCAIKKWPWFINNRLCIESVSTSLIKRLTCVDLIMVACLWRPMSLICCFPADVIISPEFGTPTSHNSHHLLQPRLRRKDKSLASRRSSHHCDYEQYAALMMAAYAYDAKPILASFILPPLQMWHHNSIDRVNLSA